MRLLDTSVVVDHLRGYAPATSLLADFLHDRQQLVASEVTRFELLAGARPKEHRRLEQFFSVLEWVPVTAEVVGPAADYARAYRRSHSGIDMADYLIAGTAVALGAELVTLNVRHFPMLGDLQPPYRY